MEYLVHSIRMGDVDDPDLYVAHPIWEWQQTSAGKYVMEKSDPKPLCTKSMNYHSWGIKYNIIAYLTPKEVTFFKLKYE